MGLRKIKNSAFVPASPRLRRASKASAGKQKSKIKNEAGAAAILMSFFVLTIILLVASTAATIMFFEIKMSREIGNSIPAFYAADAGTEQCLYQIRNSIGSEPCDSVGVTINTNLVGNGASFSVARTGPETTQSIGTFSATNRKVETNWLP